ncbi:MAG TPA: pyridoxamine 5'-phosphate oxidase family protein [Solirubrobacteraceae bacterium]|nr:pyridoxamine 5'-phosphate oxidase family protein [Solirubrobacteraceae bacterium]
MTTTSGIVLTDEIVEHVNGAQPAGKSLAIAYVDAAGRPRMSLRGSTHVHSPDQLAIWVRKAQGGIADAIREHPAVGLLYRDNDTRTTYVFSGRARIEADEAVRSEVFEACPQFEQDHDPERNGVAVLIDLDEVKGGTVGGTQVSMSRDG